MTHKQKAMGAMLRPSNDGSRRRSRGSLLSIATIGFVLLITTVLLVSVAQRHAAEVRVFERCWGGSKTFCDPCFAVCERRAPQTRSDPDIHPPLLWG